MDEQEPSRLKQAEGTPDVLNRALSALRKGPDDAARLARVGKQLEAMLDAAPPKLAQPAPGPLRPALPVLKLVAGGALLVAPLLWLAYARFGAQDTEAAQPTAALPAPPIAAVSAPEVAPPTAAPAAPAPPAREPDESARSHTHGTHARPGRRSPTLERHAQKSPETSAHAPAADTTASEPQALAVTSERERTPAQPAALEPAALEPAPQAKPRREPAPANEPKLARRAPSESELLFDARKALPADAQLALRLLTEHASRYPKGQLVPEREVLAIEALRKLGRMQEADARLQRFQTQYPHSLHLQRLQR